MFKRFQVMDLFCEKPSPNVSEWIDASNELPKKNGIFMVKSSENTMHSAYFCSDCCSTLCRLAQIRSSYWWDTRK